MRRTTSCRNDEGECNSMTNEEKIWLAGHIESGELEEAMDYRRDIEEKNHDSL